MVKPERELARIVRADLMIEDHGCLLSDLRFEYDGASQGLPLTLGKNAAAFFKGVLAAVGVDTWSGLRGKSCWVTHTDGQVCKIEPLHRRDGVPFDVEAFRKEKTEFDLEASCEASLSRGVPASGGIGGTSGVNAPDLKACLYRQGED